MGIKNKNIIMNMKNNKDKKNIINNDNILINIDKRILPIFKTPIILKRIDNIKKNEYKNININEEIYRNLNTKFRKILTQKNISYNNLLDIILISIDKYTLNLINNLNFNKNNKINLILELKKDKYYKFNLQLSRYFYVIKKYYPTFKIKSLIYNYQLFFPKQLTKVEPWVIYRYNFRDITKIYLENLNKKTRKINIKKLIITGKKILDKIENQILIKKIIITKIKNNNKSLFLSKSNYNKNFNNEKQNNNIISTQINTNIFKNNNVKNNITNSSVKHIENNKINFNLIESLNINKNNNNEIKIEQTMKSILKNDDKFDTISINSNPVNMKYLKKSNIYYKLPILNNNNIIKYKLLKKIINKEKPDIYNYLKSMSIYNMINKGIIISYSNIIGYNFNSENNKLLKNIYNMLSSSFKSMYCLISKPVFFMTPNKIIIQLFYFLLIPNEYKLKKRIKKYKKQYNFRRKINFSLNVKNKLRKLSTLVLTKMFTQKLKILCDILSYFFKKPVHFDLIRLHYPYNDSNILVNLLGIMINKIKLRIIFKKLFRKAVILNLNKITENTKVYNKYIPAYLSGLKIRVAGRLLTHRVIPRKTVKTIIRGSSAPGKINFSNVARFTNRNKRGAFSISIYSGHNLF